MHKAIADASRQFSEKENLGQARIAYSGCDGPGLAKAVMELAAALEVQETRIKLVLLEAAQAGDLGLVRKILDLWVRGPVSRVMAQLEAAGGVQIDGARLLPEEARHAGGGDVPGVHREAGE
jgi:hypothetical protein